MSQRLHVAFRIVHYRNLVGTVFSSLAEGRPPEAVACVAARTIASESAAAASAPIVSTSACPCHWPVASAFLHGVARELGIRIRDD